MGGMEHFLEDKALVEMLQAELGCEGRRGETPSCDLAYGEGQGSR